VTDCPAIQTPAPQRRAPDVCGVIVTHHPDDGFPARLNRVSRQVGRVIVVDNGSTDSELRMLGDSAADPSVELVVNGENLGVAQALNAGIQRAVTQGYAYALLLDQDTQVDDDMVATLLAVYGSFRDKERLAVVGSHYPGANAIVLKGHHPETTRRDQSTGGEDDAGPWDEVEAVITSGSLLPLAAYAVIGPFREEFFIDYVDIDYCLRARAKGYRVVKTRKQLMVHAIGSPTMHDWLGLKRSTTNHSADRRYYIARNNTVMLRESGHYSAGAWAVKSLFRCLRQCKRIALYERSKGKKIGAVAQGWWDGVRGRMGPRRTRPPGSDAEMHGTGDGARQAVRRR
jgi:rhamnosyltransferase